MDHPYTLIDDRSLLRWGGAAGLAGGLLLIVVFGIVAALVGAIPADPAGPISRFPDIRGARIIENALYLAVIGLWLVNVTALAATLRADAPAPALAGRALASLGLFALAAGALPHVATTPIADLYHAAGTGEAQRAALVAQWHATQGLFDALLVTGLLTLPAGIVALGLGMRAAPGFGTRIGAVAVALGLIGLGAGVVNLVDVSESAAIGVFALIAFQLMVGVRMLRLSARPAAAVVAAPVPQAG